jgi:hypothetical protein
METSSERAWVAATDRGTRLKQTYGAASVRYDASAGLVRVMLTTGQELLISREAVNALRSASDAALASVRLSPSRLGLYFPELDMDLSIPNLYQSEDGRHIRLA